MKKGGTFFILFFIFLFLNLDFSLVKAEGLNHLIITEVQTTGGSGYPDNEYIEIYNPTSSDINLLTLPLKIHLRNSSGSDSNKTLNFLNNTISSKGYFLIGPSSGYLGIPTLDATYVASGTKLVDSGSVYISTSSTADTGIIDKIGWGSQPVGGFETFVFPLNSAGGEAIGRKWDSILSDYTETDNNSSDFEIQSPTPKAQNIGYVAPAPITYSTKVLINEFLPAPGSVTDWDGDGTADSNDEYIELINLDDSQIDLGLWTLDDISDSGSSPYSILPGTKIDPDGFKVFYRKDTGLALNNTGDSVVLKNPNGDIVDQYSFTSSETDKSFSRDMNSLTSSWVTNYPPSIGKLNAPPQNQYPIANAGSGITSAKIGETLNFNGSASSDSDGVIVSYSWNFGDGGTSSGVTTSHSYSSSGTYQVSLMVKDNAGATSTSAITVGVLNIPVASVTPPYQNQFSSDISITEILPNPSGSNSEGEYIKVFNSGAKEINLRNWSLDDEEGGSHPYAIDYDLIIKPSSALLFYSADTKILLNNDGDCARLFDPDKKIISSVSYSGKTFENIPYTFENGTWKWKTSTSEVTKNPSVKNEILTQNDKSTTSDVQPKTPNVKNIEVKESSALLAQTSPKPVTNLATEIPGIFIDYGGAIQKEKNKVVSSSQDNSIVNNATQNPSPIKKPYQNPAVAIPIALVFSFAVLKFFLLPEDWTKTLQYLFKKEAEDISRFEELFK